MTFSQKEECVLLFFQNSDGKIVPHEMLHNVFFPGEKGAKPMYCTIDRLRRKMRGLARIVNVRGAGYFYVSEGRAQ